MDSSSSSSPNNTRGRGRGDARGRGRGQDSPFRGQGRGQNHYENPSFRGSDRGRGRGRGRDAQSGARGRGRAQPSFRGNNPQYPSRIPSHASIHPETPVSIILKQDQPTGRTVTGIVADLLTRGDHPRGVKVRLRDGRVGRVQAIVSQEEGERGETSAGGAGANLGRNGEEFGGNEGGYSGTMRGGRMERDIRDDDEYLYDEAKGTQRANEGWFAALEAADREHEGARGGGVGEEVVTCPVCMVFKGDERAVQHHVETHYSEHYK